MTYTEVDTVALSDNLRKLRKQAGKIDIMAVVKADAYGHDVNQLAPRLSRAGVHRFMVATLDEALQLRAIVPEGQILVAAPPHAKNLHLYRDYKLDLSVTSSAIAERVVAAALQGIGLRIHVKIETGMNRLGIPIGEAAAAMRLLLDTDGIDVVGLNSHLATAGSADKAFARQQIESAYAFAGQFPSFSGHFHIGNSSALLNHRDHIGRRDKEFIRLGGALLGIPGAEQLGKDAGLTPVMTLKSEVIHIKALQAGDTISYGRQWQTKAPTTIAVIGAGYADGYPSALSGRASVHIREKMYPIVGRVCMDMCIVNLGPENTTVKPGDEVVLFGSQHPTIHDLARMAGLVHYEICCRIPLRVPRRFV